MKVIAATCSLVVGSNSVNQSEKYKNYRFLKLGYTWIYLPTCQPSNIKLYCVSSANKQAYRQTNLKNNSVISYAASNHKEDVVICVKTFL